MDRQREGELDFSVIVPTYKRPDQLALCIAALQAQTYPPESFEIIVVCDGQCAELKTVPAASASFPLIRTFTIPKQGVSAARNAGVKEAHGRWMAFTDDDCAPEADWLAVLAQHLTKEPDTAVGGHSDIGLTGNRFALASAMLEWYIYDLQFCRAARTTQLPFFAGKNLAIARAQFLELGGFDETLYAAEDRDFCARWQQSGRPMRYVPKARVKHLHDLNGRSFLRQHFSYGRGSYHYQRRRVARGGERNRIEAIRFYTGLVAFPWQTNRGKDAVSLTILLLASQAANAAGFLWSWAMSTRDEKQAS